MPPFSRTTATALATLLSAYIGSAAHAGSDVRAAPAAPRGAQVVAAQARPSGAASAVAAPAEEIDALLDHAERRYPQHFPSHEPTLSASPFRFRHYAGTGISLGVVTVAGQGYVLDGVYVLGGTFGRVPVYVGQREALMRAAPEDDNGCLGLGKLDVPGRRVSVRLVHARGHRSIDSVVVGPRLFEGQSAVEVHTETDALTAMPGLAPARTYIVEKRMRRRGGGGATEDLGLVRLTSRSGGTLASAELVLATLTHAPAFTDRRHGLRAGESVTQTEQARGTATNLHTGQASDSVLVITTTTRYLGRETLNVPAGSFSACRFEEQSVHEPGTLRTAWLQPGSGALLKLVTVTGTHVETEEAVSVTVDGVPTP